MASELQEWRELWEWFFGEMSRQRKFADKWTGDDAELERRIQSTKDNEQAIAVDDLRWSRMGSLAAAHLEWLETKLANFPTKKRWAEPPLLELRELRAGYERYRTHDALEQAVDAAARYFKGQATAKYAADLIEMWLAQFYIYLQHRNEDSFFDRRSQINNALQAVSRGERDEQIKDYGGYAGAGERYKAFEVIARLTKKDSETEKAAFLRVKSICEKQRRSENLPG